MNKNAQKGLKPFVFKVVIIAMSICYVFGPSHNEVNKFLHVLTHQLEMPDNIITHSITMHSDYKVHGTHSSNKSEEVHNHKLLEFLDTLFKASDSEKNKENSKIISFKIDKHLTTKYSYKNQQLTSSIPVEHLFLFTKQKIQKGFRSGVIEPPQLV